MSSNQHLRFLLRVDRSREGLEPLTARTAVALLPVAGRPLIDHQLEALSELGAREVTLAISDFSLRIREHVGDGARFGLSIRYVLTRGTESLDRLLLKAGLSDQEVLVVAGEMARSRCLEDFLAAAGTMPGGATVRARRGLDDLGVSLVRPAAVIESELQLQDVVLHRLESLPDYLEANFAAVRGELGYHHQAREIAPRLHVGRRSRVHKASAVDGPVLVGDRVRVARSASLRGDVVVCNDSLVDAGAELHASVVLPGTYVGRDVVRYRSILWGDLRIYVDTGAVHYAGDTAEMAHMSFDPIAEKGSEVIERAVALALMLASVPLWPILLALSVLADWRSPFRTRRVVGNRLERVDGRVRRRPAKVTVAAARVRWLRSIPSLFAVVSGEVGLVGAKLREFEGDTEADPYQMLQAGLIGPAQVELPAGATREEVGLADALLNADEAPRRTFRWLSRGATEVVRLRPSVWQVEERERRSTVDRVDCPPSVEFGR